jgi:hypothetical protein
MSAPLAPTQINLPSSAVASPQAVPVKVLTAPADIRGIDLTGVTALQTLVRQHGGRIDRAGATYADLTNDGKEEAIVPITSDGTYGNLAFVVLKEQGGDLEPVLTRLAGRERRGLVMTFESGKLAETSGIYGPTDPNCCPGQIRKTYFRWNGAQLVEDRIETITIPRGPKAD